MHNVDNIVRDFSLMKQIVSSIVKLDGRNYGRCPFHEEKTPSFNIFKSASGRIRFHCFGCDAKGDVIEFVRRLHGLKFLPAVEMIEQAIGARAGLTDSPSTIISSLSSLSCVSGQPGANSPDPEFCIKECKMYANLREDYYHVLDEMYILRKMLKLPDPSPP